MMKRRLSIIGAFFSATTLSMLAGGATATENSPAETGAAETRPGVGVLCMWALVNVAAEVGRQCKPGRDVAFQAELDRSVIRFDEFVLRNSDTTPAQMAEFKRVQGMSGVPVAELCRGDPIILYEGMAAAGREGLRSQVDRILERPGPPTWGDCL